MIFPKLVLESVVQINDKTRLDGTKSFISTDEAAITLVEIEPETSAGYVDVTSLSYLDWQYSTAGTKTVTIRITTDGSAVSTTGTISVLSIADDALFSSDAELVQHEGDIMNYVRDGRSSFLDKHRAAQDRILGWLDEHRIWDNDNNRLTKDAVINNDEVNDWSKFLTLQIIFQELSNAIDDIFFEKSERYRKLAEASRARAVLRLDFDGDGTQEVNESRDIRSTRLLRR